MESAHTLLIEEGNLVSILLTTYNVYRYMTMYVHVFIGFLSEVNHNCGSQAQRNYENMTTCGVVGNGGSGGAAMLIYLVVASQPKRKAVSGMLNGYFNVLVKR